MTDTLGFSSTQPGTYWVYVSDVSCNYYEQFEFQLDTNINFTIQSDINYDYCGPVSNSAYINPTPQSGAYSYIWSTGETADSIYNVNAGVYSVTVVIALDVLKHKKLLFSIVPCS